MVQKLCVDKKWILPGLSIEILRYIFYSIFLYLFHISNARGRGRPPKNKKALLYQPGLNCLNDSSDEEKDPKEIDQQELSQSTNPNLNDNDECRDDDTDNDVSDFPDIFSDTRAITKNNNPYNLPSLPLGTPPRAIPRGRGRPVGSKNKAKK